MSHPVLDCPRRHAIALAAALCVPASVPAAPAAQDLTTVPFEQLLSMEVYSASRFLQKSSEAPSSVTVMTAGDIRDYGWRTLADVARSVRGLYVNNDRNYSYLGERGFLRPGDYNTRFLLLVDGMRINDVVYDQAPLGGEFPLDLELIERIEFVAGPGSSIYGSSAFFGVINVITKSAHDLSGVHLAAEAGGAGARRASASLAWHDASAASYLLAGSRYRSDGRDLYFPEFDTPAQNHGLATGLDYESGARLFARAAQGPLRLTLMHAERNKGVPTAAFGQAFNDARSWTRDVQTYADLSCDIASGAHTQLLARAYFGRYDSYGNYIDADAARTYTLDGSTGRWWGAEVKVVSTRLQGHKLVAGAEFQRDALLDQQTRELSPAPGALLDERHSDSRVGIYVQDEWTLAPNLLLNAGLRLDQHAGLRTVASPRAALIWQAQPDTTLKALYGSAYRAPNNYERFYSYLGDGGQLANPALDKERIASAELVLVQQLGPSSRVTASAFNNRVHGLITQLVDPASGYPKFENAEQARARGLEVEFERNWESQATLRASFSVQHVQSSPTPGLPMADEALRVNAPQGLGKLNVALPIAPGWRLGTEVQYVGQRHAVNGEAAAYWIANLNLLARQLAPHTELSISAYNLFDRHYADPGSVEHLQATLPQDGRSLRIRLHHAF
ncbi:MAG: TonB-dependent receptor [Pseudomonadota bacterium]